MYLIILIDLVFFFKIGFCLICNFINVDVLVRWLFVLFLYLYDWRVCLNVMLLIFIFFIIMFFWNLFDKIFEVIMEGLKCVFFLFVKLIIIIGIFGLILCFISVFINFNFVIILRILLNFLFFFMLFMCELIIIGGLFFIFLSVV